MVAQWQSGFEVAIGMDHLYAECHSRTSAMKWTEGAGGGEVEGLSATEAARTPRRCHASLKAPECSWRAVAPNGVAVMASMIRRAPGARISSSPLHRSGSARAGKTNALAERAVSCAAPTAQAGCGQRLGSGGKWVGPKGWA